MTLQYNFIGTIYSMNEPNKKLGTGFIISKKDGLVVTCFHVLRGGIARTPEEILKQKYTFQAHGTLDSISMQVKELKYLDEVNDIAVLNVDNIELLENLEEGKLIVSTGDNDKFYTRGMREIKHKSFEYVEITSGKITGTSKEEEAVKNKLVLQDNLLHFGMSGAPILIPKTDEIIGIIQQRYADDDKQINGDSVVWAARSEDIYNLVKEFIEIHQPTTSPVLPPPSSFLKGKSFLGVPSNIPRLSGRNSELVSVQQALNENNKVLLYGLSGIGKTALAKNAAYEWCNKHKPDGKTLWLEVGDANIDAVENEIVRLFAKEEINGKDARDILANDNSLLLVFDDVNSGAVLSQIIALAPEKPMIITSQKKHNARSIKFIQSENGSIIAPIMMGGLSFPDALELVNNLLENELSESEKVENLLETKLQGVPFALVVLAGLLNQTDAPTLDEMLRDMDEILSNEIPPEIDLDDDKKNIITLFEIVRRRLSPESQGVLDSLGKLFRPYFTTEFFTMIYKGSWSESNHKAVRSLLNELVSYSLIAYEDAEKGSTSHYTIHNLIHNFARRPYVSVNTDNSANKRTIEISVLFAEEVLKNFNAFTLMRTVENDIPTSLYLLEAERGNLLAAVEEAVKLEDWVSVNKLALALWEDSQFLNSRGYYFDAEIILKHGLEAAQKLKDSWSEARHQKNLSVLYSRECLGQDEKALPYYEAALDIVDTLELGKPEDKQGYNNLLELRSRCTNNLGNHSYYYLGDFAKAIVLYREALQDSNELLHKNPEDIGYKAWNIRVSGNWAMVLEWILYVQIGTLHQAFEQLKDVEKVTDALKKIPGKLASLKFEDAEYTLLNVKDDERKSHDALYNEISASFSTDIAPESSQINSLHSQIEELASIRREWIIKFYDDQLEAFKKLGDKKKLKLGIAEETQFLEETGRIYFNRGNAYAGLGDNKKAIDSFETGRKFLIERNLTAQVPMMQDSAAEIYMDWLESESDDENKKYLAQQADFYLYGRDGDSTHWTNCVDKTGDIPSAPDKLKSALEANIERKNKGTLDNSLGTLDRLKNFAISVGNTVAGNQYAADIEKIKNLLAEKD